MHSFSLFVTGHKGFETLLFHELRSLLAGTDAKLEKKYGGVGIEAKIDAVYRLCLHSRLANRVFCELSRAPVENEDQLYQAIAAIDWDSHLRADNSIAVSTTLSRSRLNHGHFAALRVKDAIVDQFRERYGERPAVAKKQPDIQVHVNIHQNQATISLDLSGESLHRRGYRLQHSGAPLKEHLAAALLTQAKWDPETMRLLDPMCGSGTFAIEAAMMAAGIAPGLRREYFGFRRWKMHDEACWQAILEQAKQAVIDSPQVEIYACDYDAGALEVARANAGRAGVENLVEFSHQQAGEVEIPVSDRETLVICNPPYGQRLQAEQGLAELYSELGATVRRFAPARLAVISANPGLLHRLKMQRISRKDVRNGPLQCLFAIYSSTAQKKVVERHKAAPVVDDQAAIPLRNRLVKNAKHLQRWAKRNDVDCYRVYDADLPEFAFSLDRYRSELVPGLEWFHLQEYQAPASVDSATAEYRIDLAAGVVREVFALDDDRLYCKTRSRQRGSGQYQKQDDRGEFFQVREGPASLLINLSDYLDSGLFLDHRVTREMVYRMAEGKRVLNLFCYTAAVGVLAGLGGASRVVNIDMSANYLKWARENHRLNRLDDEERYQFIRADIVELLNHPHRFSLQREFDLIFLDPPSFSNSSRMRETLDIQRDHAELIGLTMNLLKTDGLLLFSTNRRGFKLAPEVDESWEVRDITHSTVAEDFKRNPKMHLCWEIRHKAGK